MNKPVASSVFCSAFTGVLALASAADLEKPPAIVQEDELISQITFVIFDTETTGWSDADSRVIEIGAVKMKDGKVLARKSWLINPGIPITPDSQRIHGISNAMVDDCPSFREVFPKFNAFIRDSVLLAHNAAFDIRFLSAEINRNGLVFPKNEILDTLRIARTWFPELKSHSLENLVSALDIKANKMHRALADAECTAQIFKLGNETVQPDSTWKELRKTAGRVLSFRAPGRNDTPDDTH